jgi:hypothetical protein
MKDKAEEIINAILSKKKIVNERKSEIKSLREIYDYGNLTFLNTIKGSSNKFKKIIKNDKVKKLHKILVGEYTTKFEKNLLPTIKLEIKKIKYKNEVEGKRIQKLEIKYKEIAKELGYKECKICTDEYKYFKRNCFCMSDQNICLKCIGRWYKSYIEEHGVDELEYGEIPCCYCRTGTIKNLTCPHCGNENKKNCKWCKEYECIKKITSKFKDDA